MGTRGEDLFKLFAARALPGGALAQRAALLGELLDEMQRRMTSFDELERRVAELERRLDEIEQREAAPPNDAPAPASSP